ncbi:MAG: hypothetical protein AAF921_02530 [Cyanobacteria bacterium P01_D01_bin.44]
MAKNFDRVAAIPKKAIVARKQQSAPKSIPDKVVNLERVDLADRENWLRALDICKADTDQSLDGLLQEIEKYQGQIDQALQTAQAQSTIYAYAIGTRLDVIEAEQLFQEKGYANLTAFIKEGEVRRPGGKPITTRQVWAYRRVTRGLREFLKIAESIRDGRPLSPELETQLEVLGAQVNQDVVSSFLESYAESIAGVLELGVSKLEQVYRLPQPLALTGLLAGKLPLEEDIVEVHDVSFSELRRAVSSHEKKRKPKVKTNHYSVVDHNLDQLNKIIAVLKTETLSKTQSQRLKALLEALKKLGEHLEP